MGASAKPSKFREHHAADLTMWVRHDADPDAVTAAIRDMGDILKESPKAVTWRAGNWVVKSTRPNLRNYLKVAFAGKERRRGFVAAQKLEKRGIPCPGTIAYVERRFLGVTIRTWHVAEFLEGCRDVEAYVDEMIADGASPAAIKEYLAGVANAVNALTATNMFHTDLAGKNILTRDGHTFYFIDLEGVEFFDPYTADQRLKNHVQLYDSFCDRINDTYLEPFISAMGTGTSHIAMYMSAVKKGQKLRRARTKAARARKDRK